MGARKAPPGNKTYWARGETAWFEYHCEQSHTSSDAELWYHSKEPVEIIGISDRGVGRTMLDRIEYNIPRFYKIRFADGFEGVAFEDELYTSQKWFNDSAYSKGKR